MSECKACLCIGDDQMLMAFGMPSHTCQTTEPFEMGLYTKGFKKFGYDQLRHAFLYQKRHSFEVKHYYNIWEHDISDIAPQLDIGKTYEVEVAFETKNGTWARVNYYGMNQEEILKNIDEITGRLYNAMLAMNGDPDSYQRNE